MEPAGVRVARLLCAASGRTISLLPECLAAGVKGSLEAIEDTVDAANRRVGSLAQHGAELRPVAESALDADHVAGAVKWVRRRLGFVEAALCVARHLLPEKLAGCPLTLNAFRAALGVTRVLVALRRLLAARLAEVPRPVGLTPHELGPDPP